MKGVTIFSKTITAIAVIFIVTGCVYSQNPVSGTVRYSDNNEVIKSGTVQAFDLSNNLISTTSINTDGTYSFGSLPSIQLDILAFPDVGPEDDQFIPTIHPNKLDWQSAIPVCPTYPMTGIDIYVTRVSGGNSPMVASVSGTVMLDNKPAGSSIVYAKRDNNFYGFAVTDNNGNYEINGLPLGDYILVIHRIGASSSTLNITLTMEGLNNVVLNLEEAPPAFINGLTVPGKFSLGQNYPNPFNPETKINYSVPVSGNVKIAVYNGAGQLVKELINGFVNAGSYTASFAGTNLASGVYYYKLEAKGFAETKKMILVK